MSLPNTFFLGKQGYVGIYALNEIFTSSGNFTAPFEGTFLVSLAGGGGSSQGSYVSDGGVYMDTYYDYYYGFSGGGGGGAIIDQPVFLTKGQRVTFTVGQGGSANLRQNGGDTVFNNVFTAFGGSGGRQSSSTAPGGSTSSSGDALVSSFNGGRSGRGWTYYADSDGYSEENPSRSGSTVNGNSGLPRSAYSGGGGGSAIAGYGGGASGGSPGQSGVVIIRYVV